MSSARSCFDVASKRSAITEEMNECGGKFGGLAQIHINFLGIVLIKPLFIECPL